MAAEKLPVQVACRVLGVSVSGFYAHRNRTPSERSVRHAMLTDLITQIHVESHQIYGGRRIHAELTLGRGVLGGHHQVELLMRCAGLQGLFGRRKWNRIRADDIASDRVERQFARTGPDQLWVTDITEEPTREGKVYCCAVLDTYSRRVVSCSIDSSPTGALVTNALGMAIDTRLGKHAEPGTIIHSDHGAQGGFNWSSQHLDRGGVGGQASGLDEGADGSGGDAVAGRAVASSRGRAGVLEGDREGSVARGGRCGRRCVAGGRRALVPPRWRDVTVRPEGVLGPVPVLRRA